MGTPPLWLSKGEAAEFAAPDDLEKLRQALAHFPIDVNLVSKSNRRKRLLIADMDSTMIQQECIDELGIVAGVGDKIKAITARAMRGEIDFADALQERVGLMAGLDAKVIDSILRERITFMPGGKTLVATMKAQRRLHRTCLRRLPPVHLKGRGRHRLSTPTRPMTSSSKTAS